MNGKSEIMTNESKPKDLKKIRSVIAKYRNKSTDLSNQSIEGRIFKNLITNTLEIKDTDTICEPE